MAWTADDLISLARELGRFPDDALSSTILLSFADEIIRGHVYPAVRGAGAEYYVFSEDTTVVSGTTSYRIPERAGGGSLCDLTLIDSAGAETPMIEYSPRDAARFTTPNQTGVGVAYVTRGNVIRMLSNPSGTGYSLRFYYYRLPNRLVLASAAALVDSGATSASIGVTAVPSTFTTSTPLDYIQGRSGFDWLAINKTPTGVSDPITFATAPSSEGANGDYLALAGQTPVVQVPDVFFSAVAHGLAFYALRALGNLEKAGAMAAEMRGIIERESAMLTPRNRARPRVVVDYQTPLRMGAFSGRGWGWR